VLSPLSPGSLVPAVATVDIDSAVMCLGSAETASSSMYVVPSLDMRPDEQAEPGPCMGQSAPGSVPDDITDADVDSCSFELLEPTATLYVNEHTVLLSDPTVGLTGYRTIGLTDY